jgi:hypothetical protein
MLSRIVDRLMAELSDEDLDDLYVKVETERTRRFNEHRYRTSFDDQN